MEKIKSTKLGAKIWISIIVFGFIGQLAWVIENMYFNVYLFNEIGGTSKDIAAMVAASAITAAVTTLFMGALSDKLGKRKVFITFGFVIWGFVTASFGLITVENTSKIFHTANAVATAAMLLVFGGLDFLTKNHQWNIFYYIVGGITAAGGILGFFLIKDKPNMKVNDENYFKNIFYGFKLSTVKSNKILYITFIVYVILNCSYQIFMPYIIIYIEKCLGITDYAIPLGAILILAAVISVLSGKYIDKFGKVKFMLPSIIILSIGFLAMYFVKPGAHMALLIAAGTIMMGAFLITSSAVSGTIRDYTPEDKVGAFQGIRMVFQVLIPMIVGPSIGSAVIENNQLTYEEFGVVKHIPTPGIFLAAAIVAVISVVPALVLLKKTNALKKD